MSGFLSSSQPKGLFLGGRWVVTPQRHVVTSPSGGKLAEVCLATPRDVEAAIGHAHQAFQSFQEVPAYRRAEILDGVVQRLETQRDEAARLIAQEAGKPLRLARGEVSRALVTYRLSAEEAKRLHGETLPMDAAPGGEGRLGMTWRQPLGVVVAITPFNFPLNLVAHKLGPALAAGNTVVLKPAEQTPLSALFIAELFAQAGLPAGALNVLPGDGEVLSDALLLDDRVRKVSFTGSAAVGKLIKGKIGLKRCTLELGSNSALIVEPDASLDAVVPRAVFGAFAYMGQVCISLQRLFVHRSRYDELLERFRQQTGQLVIGDVLKEGTDIGPMISADEARRIERWVEEDVAAGARLVCGGKRDGAVYAPTVLTDTTPEMHIRRREVFAPAVAIIPYDTLDEAIDGVNDSLYGLNTGIYTRDISRALDAARRIESGAVHINEIPTFRVDHMPYGGVKESGYGREGVAYAIQDMTELKFVSIQLSD